MDDLFFKDWESILRTLIMSLLAYVSIIILIRLGGKRTLSQMNAYDFIVTIALGSVLASITTNSNLSLLEGLTVLIVFIFMQMLITWLLKRFKGFDKIITNDPTILLYKGRLLENNLKQQRITVEELRSEARKKGHSNLAELDIIVLETTGEISIIKGLNKPAEVMKGVKGFSALEGQDQDKAE